MTDVFKTGELFVYVNGDRWELGMVKRENNSGDGYFCWYHRGDTAANTPTRCMHKLANAGWTHIEQQMDDLRELVKEMMPFLCCMPFASCDTLAANVRKRIHNLGIDVYSSTNVEVNE